ncbi:Olfactory receptor 52D1 [Nibea albiflora]|uniref:Olfactory receptor 52D1 n=1 Tax=Nibea albiflora TaxID=240163 RepID=A0ACB7F1S9_NIBAL|nr:Olfactory receptor 52D1 [Nibea albiflora]
MDNTTTLTFTMTAYTVLENHKHVLFSVFLLLYLTCIMLNSLLISIIHQNKDLHQPMNVFTCVLSINEIYGSSALLPATMAILLSDTYEVSVKWCMAQVYFLHTFACAEFCILAVMGYDRYVAICYPLHYHSIMSTSKIRKLIALAAFYPIVLFACYYSLTLQLSMCGRVIPKLYCVNMELVKNSCSMASYISIVGLFLVLVLVMPQFLIIIFSYAQISRVCWKLSRESKRNSLKTCFPHLLSLFNYTIGSLFEILQSRFNMSHVDAEARIFLSLYFVIMPSLTNPIVYGLGTHLIRVHVLKLFLKHKILPTKLARAVIAA